MSERGIRCFDRFRPSKEPLIVKLIISLLTVSVMFLASAQESELERYEQLKSIAIFDPNVPDETINELIGNGIVSDDPVILGLTLQTIDAYVEHQIQESSGPTDALAYRTVNEITGLKEQLIKHFRSAHAKHGHRINEYVQSVLNDLPPASEGSDQNFEDHIQEYLRATSSWLLIPRILCVLWPKDGAVHTLIWEIHENDTTFGPINLLKSLNQGKFVTPSANRYRMAQLVAYPLGSRGSADMAISLAARGLALSHPPEAIPNLIQAGLDHIEPRKDVIVTLAGYENSQLEPHYNKLVSLVKGYPRSHELDGPFLHALNRLIPYVSQLLTPLEFPKSSENPLAIDDHRQRFRYLRNEGIFNPQISDETVIAMLSEGISHDDDKVVELTLRTLIEYSGAIAFSESVDMPDYHPRRPVHQVSNLRKFLIERYSVPQSQTGFDLELPNLSSDFEEMTRAELDIYYEKLKDAIPVQDAILMLLCRLWPKDPEIHSLVWAYQIDNPSVPASQMLGLLNNGKFDTLEASNYRLSQLSAYAQESGPLGERLTTMAARGLALGYPEKAIQALIETGANTDHMETREAVLITLSGYSKVQLEPYQSELAPLVNVPRKTLPFNPQIQAALDRISTIVNE